MNREQKQIIKQWREVNNQYMDNKRYEEKAALEDGNKARIYASKKKKDKLKKYSVTVSKTISVLASDEYEAEEQARADFDCTDLDCEVNDE